MKPRAFVHFLLLAVLALTAPLAAGVPIPLAQTLPAGIFSFMAPVAVTATGGPAQGVALAISRHGDSRDGSGSLRAWRIDTATGALGSQPEWDSALRLDVALPQTRTVLTHDGAGGRPLRWEALARSQRLLMADGKGEFWGRNRLDWLRGEHREETDRGGVLRDRQRAEDGRPFRQGAAAHSVPWPTGRPIARVADSGFAAWRSSAGIADRPAMVYLTANDGLLHGFDASDGSERLAYLPAGVLPSATASALPGWPLRYLLDGPVFSADADIHGAGQPARWATVLVGTGGLGARGYFVLDASRPAQFSESRAAAIVLLDTTATPDPDIGHLVSPAVPDEHVGGAAQITRLNDGRWALLLGNGVNSAREMPVLLIQYLDQQQEIRRIAPRCPRAPAPCPYRGANGLSTPAVIDVDGNGTADMAYAGDLLGHFWKFDLSSADAAHWKIGFDGAPWFTARDEAGHSQPISTAPAWLPHVRGGVLLAFGTGRMLSAADRADTQVQTLYGLHDDSAVTIGAPAAGLGRITIADGAVINLPQDTRRPVALAVLRPQATLLPPGDRRYEHTVADRSAVPPGQQRGWRMDLPASGERLLQTPRDLGGRQLLFASTAADGDFVTVIDAGTGDAPGSPVFAALAGSASSGGSAEEADDSRANRATVSPGGFLLRLRGAEWSLTPASGASLPAMALRRGGGKPLRAGWRQLR